MKYQSLEDLREIDDDQPGMTVPQVIQRLREVYLCFTGDPCLADLASQAESLIGQVEERCRLAAEVAAEARREHELH